MDMALKYKLKVLLDVHGLKDSQNGGPSSGLTNWIIWESETEFSLDKVGEWMGPWD